ncbi:MAG TPA: STT3 domain-containing protein [Thermoanaerobaculia bacterium]|nr:STT3 domain-containing protein [Thermoanaerobaculia bacterium]
MNPRRLVFFLGLAVSLLVGIAIRLSTREQLLAGGRARTLTSDDDYHMRRARFAAANYPRTIVFDPLMNFPKGGVPIWPPLYDVALATPARLLHGSSATPEQVARGAFWVPVVFAAGSILLAGWLGKLVAGEISGAVLALFVAICPGHILWTQYGHTDQHVAESFFGLLVLCLFLRRRSNLWTGIVLALAVLAWQGAIYWGAIIALALFVEAILTRESVLRPAVLILGVSAALSAAATSWWLGGVRPPLTYISFGFFQPLFLAALAGGTILLETLLRATRRQLDGKELRHRAIAVAAAAAAVLPFAGPLATGFFRGIGYAAGTTSGEATAATGYISYPKNWLSGIFEARPLLADGPGLAVEQLSAAFLLAPLVVLLWAARAKQSRPAFHAALAIWGIVTIFLALSQRLNVYYAAPLAGLALIEAATLARRFGKTPATRTVAAAACGLALAIPMAPGIREEVTAVRVPGSDFFDTMDWMRDKLPHAVDAYDPRLLSPSPPPELSRAESVLAPWSLGHRVLYNAELPVIGNNFGYGFNDSIRFFIAGSEEEALAIARSRRARWVLATDLVPRMNDYAGYFDRPPYLRQTDRGPMPLPSYFSTMQARLYDFDGGGFEGAGNRFEPVRHFRLVHASRSGIPRGTRWLARWKVFEILE